MRTPPFYTYWQNDPLRDVWHNNDHCPFGRAIPAEARLPGTDHMRARCSRCAQLNQADAAASISTEILWFSAMQINSLPNTDGSRCTLSYNEAGPWLRATWRGFVDQAEATRGAENYLAHAGDLRCACLLNDNAALRGPWFDTAEWLERAWLPRAQNLGLRYVAHVVQADTGTDILTLTFSWHLTRGGVELQLFDDVAHAETWLRECQRRF